MIGEDHEGKAPFGVAVLIGHVFIDRCSNDGCRVNQLPLVDLRSLSAEDAASRQAFGDGVTDALREAGCVGLVGIPEELSDATQRERIFGVFDTPDETKRKLLKRSFASEQPNIYRGFFPYRDEDGARFEGYDIGPDIVDPKTFGTSEDPLHEPTPLPKGAAHTAWLKATQDLFVKLDKIGANVLGAVSQSLFGSSEHFARLFSKPISTIRLIHYPQNDEVRGRLLTTEHVDSGFLTLIHQSDSAGFEYRAPDGNWITPDADPSVLIINAGKLLDIVSENRSPATVHRVRGHGARRRSIAFFYEPSADATISPVRATTADFSSFLYGDYLWRHATAFKEQEGMRDMRAPRGPEHVVDQFG